MTTAKPVLFSGIQPSGKLVLGNYIGALKHWVALQHDYACLFSLVDLHAITVTQDPRLLRERCYEFLSLYMACGIDPEKNVVFVQSHVSAHAELAWILNCHTYMGELKRMTQFKDKSKQHAENINAGLFLYPVLMAADILLYRTKLVPVGEDQKQHLELARDLAMRFNKNFGDIFVIPEPYIPPVGARIMSLQDPTKKMSKSDVNPNGYISLLDQPDVIKQKIQKSVTDSGKDIIYAKEKPGISNLLTIYSVISGKTIAALEEQYLNKSYGIFKKDIIDAIIEFLSPIQKSYYALRNNEDYLKRTLENGAMKARLRAKDTLKKVHDAIGFIA